MLSVCTRMTPPVSVHTHVAAYGGHRLRSESLPQLLIIVIKISF